MKFLAQELIQSAFAQHAARPAISWYDAEKKVQVEWNYEELHLQARSVAAFLNALQPLECNSSAGAVVLCMEKSPVVYAIILGCILANRCFVPLHPRTPIERLKAQLEALGGGVIFSTSATPGVISAQKNPDFWALHFYEFSLPKTGVTTSEWREQIDHLFEFAALRPQPSHSPSLVRRELSLGNCGTAYVVMTSGSSGIPKAIPVGRSQLDAYLQNTRKLWDFSSVDRLTQIYELSFDPAISDIFWAFTNGACLCPFSTLNLANLGGYLERERPTVFGIPPSVLRLALDSGALTNRSFASVRFSAFIGEALKSELVARWARHAPNSVIENQYGPAEATISVSRYRVPRTLYEAETKEELSCPIGQPYEGIDFVLLDDQQNVSCGNEGELAISGQQVNRGYLKNHERTKKAFVSFPWDTQQRTWYRTGDLMTRKADGNYVYLRRIDRQVKLLGQRLELGEIETAVARCSPIPVLGAFLWPLDQTDHATGIIAVLGAYVSASEILTIREQLPKYLSPFMRPRAFFYVATPPLNTSGKIDKIELQQQLLRGEYQELSE